MAKGQNALQQQNTQLARQLAAQSQQDRQALQQGTPEEQARRARVAARRTAIDKGDWANAPDFYSDSASVADRYKKRQTRMNVTPTGTAALGMAYANPNAVAQTNQVLADQWDNDAAQQFEGDVKRYSDETNDMELGIIRDRNDINNALLNNSSSRSLDHYSLAAQLASRRGSWLPSLISGGLGAAGSAFAGAI